MRPWSKVYFSVKRLNTLILNLKCPKMCNERGQHICNLSKYPSLCSHWIMLCRMQSLLESRSQWLNRCYRELIVWEADLAMKLDRPWKHLGVNGDKASAVALEWWIWMFLPIWRLLVHTVLMMLLRIEMVASESQVWLCNYLNEKHGSVSCEHSCCYVHKFRLPAVDLAKHRFQPFIHTHLHKHAHLRRQICSHTCSLCRSSWNVSSFTLTGT